MDHSIANECIGGEILLSMGLKISGYLHKTKRGIKLIAFIDAHVLSTRIHNTI